jgi:hypothetical protein
MFARLPKLPSGYLTVRHGKWPIYAHRNRNLPNLKMVDLSMAMLNNQMVQDMLVV